MCGIFGILSNDQISILHLHDLAQHARQRGRDSSGILYTEGSSYQVSRADYDILRFLKKLGPLYTNFAMGHSRLITNGLSDNQPVVRDGLVLIHNGIVVNDDQVWSNISKPVNIELILRRF